MNDLYMYKTDLNTQILELRVVNALRLCLGRGTNRGEF